MYKIANNSRNTVELMGKVLSRGESIEVKDSDWHEIRKSKLVTDMLSCCQLTSVFVGEKGYKQPKPEVKNGTDSESDNV